MGGGGSRTVVRTETVTVTDPNLVRDLENYRRQNEELMKRFNELNEQIERQRIHSFEDLQQVDRIASENLIKLASKTEPIRLGERAYGFFGLTSTGKSTMINKLIGFDLAETGAGETTKEIQPYDGQGFRLFDIPGRNDDLSYFSMEYIAFWKGLTRRLILITSTVKEMTKVLRLLDALHLRYDIVVNKFDLVALEERATFKKQVDEQIRQCRLEGVDHVWYISAKNPEQFPHWLVMVDQLTSTSDTNFHVDDNDDEFFQYVVYE